MNIRMYSTISGPKGEPFLSVPRCAYRSNPNYPFSEIDAKPLVLPLLYQFHLQKLLATGGIFDSKPATTHSTPHSNPFFRRPASESISISVLFTPRLSNQLIPYNRDVRRSQQSHGPQDRQEARPLSHQRRRGTRIHNPPPQTST